METTSASARWAKPAGARLRMFGSRTTVFRARLWTTHVGQRQPTMVAPGRALTVLSPAVAHDSSILSQVNHQLESRMREIRTSGSEGGGAETLSLPLSRRAAKFQIFLARGSERASYRRDRAIIQFNK